MSGASEKETTCISELISMRMGFSKLKRLLKELIETSNQPLTLPINWEDVVVLGTPIYKIL